MTAAVTLLPQELVLRVAAATVGASEVGGPNAGPYVERVLELTGLGKGSPWCAAHVAAVGVAALGKDWPVPRTASCYQLGEWGKQKKVLREKPAPGAIFLMHFPTLKRFGHTGFCTEAGTNEGNTNAGGSREGWLVAERTRTWGPRDRFIYWWEAM